MRKYWLSGLGSLLVTALIMQTALSLMPPITAAKKTTVVAVHERS